MKGNRAVRPHVWALVEAMERAFPLLLSPGTGLVRHVAGEEGTLEDPDRLADLWIMQVGSRTLVLTLDCDVYITEVKTVTH